MAIATRCGKGKSSAQMQFGRVKFFSVVRPFLADYCKYGLGRRQWGGGLHALHMHKIPRLIGKSFEVASQGEVKLEQESSRSRTEPGHVFWSSKAPLSLSRGIVSCCFYPNFKFTQIGEVKMGS